MKFFIFILSTLLTLNVFAIVESVNFENQYKHKVSPFLKSSIPILYPSFDQKKMHAYYFKRNFKNLLIIIPGFREAAAKYQELVYDLKDVDYDFIIVDLRSQGKSDRLLEDKKKVHVNHYSDYIRDLEKLHQLFIKNEKYEKIVIIGHSLGGAIALGHAQRNPGLYKGMILSSPMVEIKNPAGEFFAKNYTRIATMVGFGSSYAPGAKKFAPSERKLSDSNVTQSEIRFKTHMKFRITHKEQEVRGATNNWVSQAFAFSDYIYKNREKIKNVPTLMFLAGKDTLSHSKRQSLMCNEQIDCDKVLFKDAKHNILDEKDIFRNHAISKIKYFLAHGNVPKLDLKNFKGK